MYVKSYSWKKSRIDTCFLSPIERVAIRPHLSALAAEDIDEWVEAAAVEIAAADVMDFGVAVFLDL